MKPKEKVTSWPKCESDGLKKIMNIIKTVITETSDMASSAKNGKAIPACPHSNTHVEST